MTEPLKPWYAVATPHEDIREGRLAEAVFAANLWAVVQRTAPEVYLDPEEFFRKTYLTTGLSTVLRRVAGALNGGGESGDRIISLQTAFGGGKTHTLVALWHLAKHADRLYHRIGAVALFTSPAEMDETLTPTEEEGDPEDDSLCLDPTVGDLLGLYLTDQLSEADYRRVEAHVAEACDYCAALLAEIGRPPERPAWWRPAESVEDLKEGRRATGRRRR